MNCYEGLADGYVTLERAEKDIPAWTENVNIPANAQYYSWMFTEPNRPKMWEVIHSVNPAGAASAVDAALARNASVLYLTDDVLPNPYDSLPRDETWKAVLDRVSQYSNGAVPLPAVKQLVVPTAVAGNPAVGKTGNSAKPTTKRTTKRRVTRRKR